MKHCQLSNGHELSIMFITLCMILNTESAQNVPAWIADYQIFFLCYNPGLKFFFKWLCSVEPLPTSCLQNIHIQSTISTIAINKRAF